MSDNKSARTRQVVTAHPSSVKHSNVDQTSEKGVFAPIFRNLPVTFAVLFSIAWTLLCGFYIQNSDYSFNGNLIELSSLITAVSAPIIIVWLICLVILRVNPIADHRRALETGLDQLLSPVEVTQERINKVIENLSAEIEKIDGAGDKASDKFKNLREQVEELSNLSEALISNLEDCATKIKKNSKSMEKSIEKASDQFQTTVNELDDITDNIEDSISLKIDDLKGNIAEQFNNVEAEIDRGNSAIGELLSGNLDTIETHVRDTLKTIQTQSDKIDDALSKTKDHISERTKTLTSEYELFKEYADDFNLKISNMNLEFKDQHKNIMSAVSVIEDGVAVAIDKMNNNSTRLGAHGQKIIENILSLSADINDQIIDIQNRSKTGLREIENASLKASESLINREESTTKVLNTWLNTASHVRKEHNDNMKRLETMIDELTTIEKSTAKSVGASEDKIKRISNELLHSSDRIHIASNAAVEAVEEANYALDQNADKYQQMINAIQFSSQSLATNAEAIEKRLKRINSERFSEVSEKIMEKLQSGSIDVAKYLEGDIPKDLWDKYISGDKNIFIRKIKKHLGKKATAEIRKQYLEDRDFRMNSDSFLQLFEEMLGTFNENSDDLYRETLITSDVGKVYFALAEATGRLN